MIQRTTFLNLEDKIMITANLIFLGILAFSMVSAYFLVRGKKLRDLNKEITIANPKTDKLTIIVLCTYLIYSVIGYLFKIEILIPFEFYEGGGSVNFLLPILALITSLLLRYIMNVGMRLYNRKSS